MKQHRFDFQEAVRQPAPRRHDVPKHVLLFALIIVGFIGYVAWKTMA